MRKIRWICLLGLLLWPWAEVQATGWRKYDNELHLLNKRIAGKVMDYTANHGQDNRMWSRTLFQRRDLYIYLPPGYQPCQPYPFMIWLHGFNQDERSFIRYIVPALDEAIRCGKLPPLIVAAPDGTFKGEADPLGHESFFLNTPHGDFADFILQDVWDFVCHRHPIRTEREAHILAGVSMGGFAAYNFAFKHREAFGTVIGIMPPLNMRWTNQRGKLMANFDPRDWGWKDEPTSKVKSLALFPVSKAAQMHRWMELLYGGDESVIWDVSRENPIEMLDRYHIAPCQLEMYIAYTGNDHYNIDAQVESFLYLAHWRGLHVTVDYDMHAPHSTLTAMRFLPGVFNWLAPRIAPYSPVMACEEGCYGDLAVCGPDGCPSDVCPTSSRRRLFHRRHQPCDDGSCGYPHTLPDPARLSR